MSEILTTLHPENDETVDLYPNIKRGNIPSKTINIEKLDDDVKALLNNIGTLRPQGVASTATITAYTYNRGIWVSSTNGHWFYWDGTQYVDSEREFVSSANIVSHNGNQLIDSNNANLYPNTYDINFIRFDKYGLQGTNILVLNTGLPYHGNSNLARASYTRNLTINGIPSGRTLRIYKVDSLTESLSGKGTIINNGDTITIENNKYYKFTLDGDVDNQATNCDTIYYNEIIANAVTLDRLNNYVMNGYIVFNKYGLQSTNINTLNTGLPYHGHSDLFRSKFNFSVTAYGIPEGRTLRIYVVDTQTESLSGKGTILTNGTSFSVSKNKWYRYTIDGDSTTPATSITSIYLDIEPLSDNKWYGKKFGFIGDSITIGQYSTKSYPQYIRDSLGVTISNQAVAGNTLEYIYNQINNLPDDLDAVFVMGGTNNYKSTGIQGRIGDLFKIVDNVTLPNDDNSICGYLNKICIRLKELYPNALIVLLVPPKSSIGYNNSADTTAPFNLMDLRKAYYDVGEVNSCMVIDISSECIINSQIEESADIYYTHVWTEQESPELAGQQDLTHPTALGHEEIAKTIINKIK